MEPWVVWALATLFLFILEVFVPGFFLACLGVGCLCAGLSSIFQTEPAIQLFVFAMTTLITLFGLRPFFLKYLYKEEDGTRTNTGALIGKNAVVTKEIQPVHGLGRVKVGGEDWKGESIDGQPIPAGVLVIVERVEGNKVLVRGITEEKEEI